ncbi:fimbrial biogenesis chaperone [Enterobacter cloacae]|uniref:fimbrial biogenesis chaperone n=1 Tax=Enterobacter cloacae TaxID=550 RepID=UPI002B211F3B|nr:molecular chaperone [Enterobacter cloacae]MEA5217578.1 molecular chaperone [Enterobacter cloacae]
MSLCLLAASATALAEGGVSFTRNRLVFNEGEKAISLSVVNHGENPYLIQAGVSTAPDAPQRAPFLVTPPLFRLDGHAQNMMRIVGDGAGLPRDRESVFYFYASAIPGQRDAHGDTAGDGRGGGGAQLSIAMKTVLKLFYRPKGLAVSPDKARGMMRFVQQGGRVVIENPTPYYQSFAQLSFDGVQQDLDRQVSMLAPGGRATFTAGKPVKTVSWSVMNDYGGSTPVVTQPVNGAVP